MDYETVNSIVNLAVDTIDKNLLDQFINRTIDSVTKDVLASRQTNSSSGLTTSCEASPETQGNTTQGSQALIETLNAAFEILNKNGTPEPRRHWIREGNKIYGVAVNQPNLINNFTFKDTEGEVKTVIYNPPPPTLRHQMQIGTIADFGSPPEARTPVEEPIQRIRRPDNLRVKRSVRQ